MIEKLLPTIVIIEMLAAAMPYIYMGKWGTALYWLSAGLINIGVVYLMPRFG